MSIIKITITPVVYNLVKSSDFCFGYGFKIKGFNGVWEHCGKDPSTGKEVILQLNEGEWKKYKGYVLIETRDLELFKEN